MARIEYTDGPPEHLLHGQPARDVMFAVTTTGDGWVFLEDPSNGDTLARTKIGNHVDDAIDRLGGAQRLAGWLETALYAHLLHDSTCPDCGNVGLDHAEDCDYRVDH